jgi:hypothetical protein
MRAGRVGLLGVVGMVGLATNWGCSASPAMRAADRGDRAALRDAISAREVVGTLSDREAASLARVVARRDLATATPAEAIDRVRDALPCARELDGALARRMDTHDAAGAVAALARMDARGLDFDDARAFAGDPDPAWRAVGTRALVRPSDHAARVRALVDGDPLVRRQAARAARDAVDPADLAPLAEAARLDPEPIVRTEAVRSLAALPLTPRGDVAYALRDLWTAGDPDLREDIALAWASPTVWAAGGVDALHLLVASGHGPGAIEAAAAVLRHPGASAAVTSAAVAQIVRSIQAGPRPGRLQALAQAPLDRHDVLEAVRTTTRDEDVEVRIAALARIASSRGPDAKEAIAGLEDLAQPASPAGPRARFALASAGDRRVQAWVEQDLAAPSPQDRLGAATALAMLGVAGRAAPLLGDDDPGVRVRAACTILMAARIAR